MADVITEVDIGADIRTEGEGATTDEVVVLVAPLIVAGLALGSIYAVGKTVDDYRYWTDYHSNTGHLPRYPFRSGMGDGFKYGSGLSYGYYKVFR